MPIPFLVAGLMVAGGVAVGALMRQPEINRLKAQVSALQKEIVRLQKMIEEQQRQICELKLRYDTVIFFRIFEKQRIASNLKGKVLHFCAFKEYMDVSIAKLNKTSVSDGQNKFFRTYEIILIGNESDISDDDFDAMTIYIENKYSLEIETMTAPDIDREIGLLQSYNG